LQIRKIARRYKSQYEELTTKVEEERKAGKEREEAAATAAASMQEKLLETQRDEGRKEVEGKVKEVESRHSAVVKELTEQVSLHNRETLFGGIFRTRQCKV
jgi:hypothetical protein